jgi:hypothetical protein
VECRKCGHLNPQGEGFCAYCGNPLPLRSGMPAWGKWSIGLFASIALIVVLLITLPGVLSNNLNHITPSQPTSTLSSVRSTPFLSSTLNTTNTSAAPSTPSSDPNNSQPTSLTNPSSAVPNVKIGSVTMPSRVTVGENYSIILTLVNAENYAIPISWEGTSSTNGKFVSETVTIPKNSNLPITKIYPATSSGDRVITYAIYYENIVLDTWSGSLNIQLKADSPTSPSTSSKPTTTNTSTPVSPGTLSVTSYPGGVSVFVGGEFSGTTSGSSSGSKTVYGIVPGTYTLKLTMDGYKEWTKQVTIAGNQTTTVYAYLESGTGISAVRSETIGAAVNYGTLSVTSYPGGVSVFVGGEFSGTTSGSSSGSKTVYGIVPGTYTLKLTMDGYKEWTDQVTIVANQTTTTKATLIK